MRRALYLPPYWLTHRYLVSSGFWAAISLRTSVANESTSLRPLAVTALPPSFSLCISWLFSSCCTVCLEMDLGPRTALSGLEPLSAVPPYLAASLVVPIGPSMYILRSIAADLVYHQPSSTGVFSGCRPVLT